MNTPEPTDTEGLTDKEVMQILEERDRAEEWADKLAYAKYGIEQIGEHSSSNNPWAEALELLENEAALDKLDKEQK